MSQIIKVILLSIFNGEQGTLPDTFGVLLILLASRETAVQNPASSARRLHFGKGS